MVREVRRHTLRQWARHYRLAIGRRLIGNGDDFFELARSWTDGVQTPGPLPFVVSAQDNVVGRRLFNG
jgi:hypothetical protein